MKIKKMTFSPVMAVKMNAMFHQILQPKFHNVLEDLIEFTGLDRNEVLFRIIKKLGRDWGARGWFNNEFDWHDPSSNRELCWFYVSAQSYLFSNARRPYWNMLKYVKDGPVLDYGCGIGQNILELAKRGFEVRYLELGLLQQEFLKFRIIKHHITNAVELDLWSSGFLNTIDCVKGIQYGTILLQHVLEHIPSYQNTLRHLISNLKVGGRIIEHSPFRSSPGNSESPQMHLKAEITMKEAMIGMKKIYGGDSVRRDANVWEKI